jgi:hypothetical protein
MRPGEHASELSSLEGAEVRPQVDETLIDEMLSLSVRDRLRQNDRMVRTVLALQTAFAHRAHGGTK